MDVAVSNDCKEQTMSESRGGEHAEALERLESMLVDQTVASDAMAEHAVSNARAEAAVQFYAVGLANGTDFTLGVLVQYVTTDQPGQIQNQGQISPPQDTIIFALTPPGQCATLAGYVMLFYLDQGNGWEFVARWPAQGYWTAQRVSQEYPNDQDPCVDVWGIA
jgi:hypothetical protein